jgi:hypothetical protein
MGEDHIHTHVYKVLASYPGRYVRMGDDEERVLCCVLTTAEFCKETCDSLAGAIKKDLKPGLGDQASDVWSGRLCALRNYPTWFVVLCS